MEALKREMKRWLLSMIHNIDYRIRRRRLQGLLKDYDPRVCENVSPQKKETICFVITRMVRFHGGQTSILRLGTRLEKLGMKVTYLVYKPQSVKEMCKCAASNLEDYKGECAAFDAYFDEISAGKREYPDIVVASSWDTVSRVKRFDKAYKMYFVQDYEPYFYEYGEEFFMSKCTYEQGLHMVSLGGWNSDMIRRECTPISPIDVVNFPYERKEYPGKTRDFKEYANRTKFTIAVYVKYYGKRLPNLIPYMMENTIARLKEKGIELEVLYFGEARSFKAKGGKNLGHLTKKELLELYRRADFGMVASMSNISLVPYEMHAAGLPLIEFEDGTYLFFFPEESALLTSVGRQDIADLLLEAVKNPDRLEKMQESAAAVLENLSWEQTGEEFYEIIKRI